MSANANAIQPRQINVPLVVVGAIVVIASFAATVLIGQLSGRPTAAAPGATQSVLVAARDVAARKVLVAGDLTIAHYAVADVPPAALTTAGAAVGLVAETPLKKGQPVLSNQVAKDAGAGGLSAYLPLAPGFVALTVPSDEQHGVGGYVQAGDYIDVVAVVTPRNATTANVRTIYSNIRVIRVGPAAVTSGAAAGAQQTGGTTTSLTLAVTQCQAEYINWFVANAQLRYTLLAYQDYQATPAAADTNCPKAGSAAGVVEADIRSHWPGLD
jgi:Flp pilus assembly protein CpaB